MIHGGSPRGRVCTHRRLDTSYQTGSLPHRFHHGLPNADTYTLNLRHSMVHNRVNPGYLRLASVRYIGDPSSANRCACSLATSENIFGVFKRSLPREKQMARDFSAHSRPQVSELCRSSGSTRDATPSTFVLSFAMT